MAYLISGDLWDYLRAEVRRNDVRIISNLIFFVKWFSCLTVQRVRFFEGIPTATRYTIYKTP